MIISNIIGGLGNQMFQYAAGRALALNRDQPLMLDVSGFSNYKLHQGFELKNIFEIPAHTATLSEIASILGWRSFSGVKRFLSYPSMASLRGSSFILEPHFNYWPDFEKIVINEVYISGYWQSEKYFKEYELIIKRDFCFKKFSLELNIDLAKKITQLNSISLHVRRGDYVSHKKTSDTHGVCSIDYYKKAVSLIGSKVQNPYFFIFSDDISWVKKNLNINFPCEFINHNRGDQSFNDMHLMSLCRNNIIANSSFSWWGAWLNNNLNKIVIAPKKWFANDAIIVDLIPDEWVTI